MPFRGLLPFAEQHANVFFGRDAEIAAFLERMLTVLQRLDREALEATVREPVEAAGYRYEDPELVGDLVASVFNEPAGLLRRQ